MSTHPVPVENFPKFEGSYNTQEKGWEGSYQLSESSSTILIPPRPSLRSLMKEIYWQIAHNYHRGYRD